MAIYLVMEIQEFENCTRKPIRAFTKEKYASQYISENNRVVLDKNNNKHDLLKLQLIIAD